MSVLRKYVAAEVLIMTTRWGYNATLKVCVSVEKYKNCQPLAASSNSDRAADPLINLDSKSEFYLFYLCKFEDPFLTATLPPAGNSPDFKAGITALANILKIQRHDDYLVMLKVSTAGLRADTIKATCSDSERCANYHGCDLPGHPYSDPRKTLSRSHC